MGFIFIFSAYWLIARRHELATPNQIESYFSREAAFLYNNFLFMAILAIVFLFTFFPIISELFTGERGFVGPPVYEQALAPLFALLLLLMGVAPLTMWFRTSPERIGMALRWPALAAAVVVVALVLFGVRGWGPLLGVWIVSLAAILTVLEFWKGTRARMNRGENAWTAYTNLLARNRRRYGGYWIHMGVIVMAFGIIGVEAYQQQTQIRLERGESVMLGPYEMQFDTLSRYAGPDDLIITEAAVNVWKDGNFVGQLFPRSEFYVRTEQPMTIPDARSTFTEDFYVLLINWEPTSVDSATFRIYLNPLINWVWAGGFIFVLGTLVAAWPDRRDEKVLGAESRRPVAVPGRLSAKKSTKFLKTFVLWLLTMNKKSGLLAFILAFVATAVFVSSAWAQQRVPCLKLATMRSTPSPAKSTARFVRVFR
jgi:cytochrome c-type biogenesis protein CcmF